MHIRTKSLMIGAAALILLTCGGEVRRQTGEMLSDAGAWLESMDASAQNALVGRVVSAESDPSRMESELVTYSADRIQIAAGPMVITDLVSYAAAGYWFAPIGACTTATTTFLTTDAKPLTGLRLEVEAGRAFCGNSHIGATLLWTGFRPYE